MFSNVLRQVETKNIIIDRSTRQRSVLTFDSVLSLAVSIGRSQWISPILIDENTNYLIAGERRLTAVKALAAATEGDYSNFTDSLAAREELFPVCTCRIDSWKHWTKIPAQLGKNFTSTDIAMYEFIENAQRQDLPWQDRAKAIYDIHARGTSQDKEWTAVHTSNLIGVHRATVTENLRIWRLYADEEASVELKEIIQSSPTLRSAMQTAERYTSRRETGLGVSLASGGMTPRPKAETALYNKPGPAILTDVYKNKTYETHDWSEDEPEEELISSDKLLINDDFISWAPLYTGEPFNFIHCDFPYGIDLDKSVYVNKSYDTLLGEYKDSSDVYWKLLYTLRDNRHLIAPQAHIMFWFSQVFRRETEDFFASMGGTVQPFLMIWHCFNEGIIPDIHRYGRRTYETALLVTFGDRKIVSPRALSIEAPREIPTRIHRSQKPIRVLRHFFEMFVDDSSIVLDPTAGSGTSLIVADELKANKIIGLEIDLDIYKNARKHINTAVAIKI